MFVSWGLVSSHRVALSKTLYLHLDDFKKSLLADGNTKEYAELKHGRVEKIFTKCGFQTFSDIAGSKVKIEIARLKKTVKKKVG